jgi:hypothetical protein
MALSSDIRNFIKDSQLGLTNGPVIGDREGLELLGQVVNWVTSHDSQLVLSGPAAPAASARTNTVTLSIEDAAGKLNNMNQTSTVVVTVTGGASGKLINGVAGPITVTMVDGQASLAVSATSVGTLILGLSAPSPAGLTVTSTHTTTFS